MSLQNAIIYNRIYLSFEQKYTLINKMKNGDRNVVNIIKLMFESVSQSVFRPAEVSSRKTVKPKKKWTILACFP